MQRDQLARLRRAMLPMMAAALFMPCYEGSYRLGQWALDEGSATTGPCTFFGAQALVALLVALLASYPLARLYGRQAAPVGTIVAVAVAAYFFLHVPFDGPLGLAVVVLELLGLCLLVPLVAGAASWALRDGPQLAWRGEQPTDEPSPVALAWVLVPLLAMGFFVLHDAVQYPASVLAFSAPTPALDRAGMFLVALAKPALLACLLAAVVARVYDRRTASVAVLVVLPTAIRWAWLYIADAYSPWVRGAYVVELIGLLALAPLLAAWTRRRLGAGRLVFTAPGAPTSR